MDGVRDNVEHARRLEAAAPTCPHFGMSGRLPLCPRVVLRCCILGGVSGVEAHRAAVDRVLSELGLGWEAWPDIMADPRLDPGTRMSAVLVWLADVGNEGPRGAFAIDVRGLGEDLDKRARELHPWEGPPRLRLPWTAPAATTAVESVARGWCYDERRFALALRGAKEVCAAGQADAALMAALVECIARLEREEDEEWRIKEMRGLARRVVASATPPGLLDLSLLVDGDAWAGPARQAARELPADQVAPLVRLLGELGPRKPPQKWLRAVDEVLEAIPARRLLRRWIELAACTNIVPEWPGSRIGVCLGTLFVGTNTDVVRAAVWATSRVPDEEWPYEQLGVLARRGAAHNDAPGFPEALSLKVASARSTSWLLGGEQGTFGFWPSCSRTCSAATWSRRSAPSWNGQTRPRSVARSCGGSRRKRCVDGPVPPRAKRAPRWTR